MHMRKRFQIADSRSLTSESDDCVISKNSCRDNSQSEDTDLIPLEGASSKISGFLVKTASLLRGINESETK